MLKALIRKAPSFHLAICEPRWEPPLWFPRG